MLMKSIKFIFVITFGLIFSIASYAGTSVDSLFRHANDPIAGNKKGDVTVVEFFDYNCSHCVNMGSTIDAIIKKNPNVRIVFKEYPIRGPMSEVAARAALAANKQGKYYQFSHALLTSNLALNENNMTDIAKSVGLDIKKWKKDINSKSVKDQILANYALARELDITGTPAFFIGKTSEKNSSNMEFVLGEMSESELQKAINKANA